NLRLNAAAIDQNRLNGLRYSVASNAFRTVSRHDPDDQSPGNRDENAVAAQMVAHRRNHRAAPPAKVTQVRKQPDQTQYFKGDERAQRTNTHRQSGDGNRPRSGRKITQLFVATAVPCFFTVVLRTRRAAASHLGSPIFTWTNSLFFKTLRRITILQKRADGLHQRGAAGAQLADAVPRHLFQQLFSARQQPHQDTPAVVPAAAAAHVTVSLQPVDQFDGAVMLQRQAIR